jgi:hypothetical protein
VSAGHVLIAVRIAKGLAQQLSWYRRSVIPALLARGYLALMDAHKVPLYDYWDLHEPHLL